MDFNGMIAIVLFFFSVASIWGAIIFTRHRERVLMIDKGLTAEEIRSLYARAVRNRPLLSLKWGIILISVGLAIVLSLVATEVYYVDEGVYPALIILFAGLGLVLFYQIAKKVGPENGEPRSAG
ncbi:MAG: DUF6249 domain-containing protein [Bacteroidota bacterium]